MLLQIFFITAAMINRYIQHLSRHTLPLLQQTHSAPLPTKAEEEHRKKFSNSKQVALRHQGALVPKDLLGLKLPVSSSNIKALTLESTASIAMTGQGPVAKAVERRGLTVRADFFQKLEKIEQDKLRRASERIFKSNQAGPSDKEGYSVLPTWRTSTPKRPKPPGRRRPTSVSRMHESKSASEGTDQEILPTAVATEEPKVGAAQLFEEITVVEEGEEKATPRRRKRETSKVAKSKKETPRQRGSSKSKARSRSKTGRGRPRASKKSTPRKRSTSTGRLLHTSPTTIRDTSVEVNPTSLAITTFEETEIPSSAALRTSKSRSISKDSRRSIPSNSKAAEMKPKRKTPRAERSKSASRSRSVSVIRSRSRSTGNREKKATKRESSSSSPLLRRSEESQTQIITVDKGVTVNRKKFETGKGSQNKKVGMEVPKICSAYVVLADEKPCTVSIEMKWKEQPEKTDKVAKEQLPVDKQNEQDMQLAFRRNKADKTSGLPTEKTSVKQRKRQCKSPAARRTKQSKPPNVEQKFRSKSPPEIQEKEVRLLTEEPKQDNKPPVEEDRNDDKVAEQGKKESKPSAEQPKKEIKAPEKQQEEHDVPCAGQSKQNRSMEPPQRKAEPKQLGQGILNV